MGSGGGMGLSARRADLAKDEAKGESNGWNENTTHVMLEAQLLYLAGPKGNGRAAKLYQKDSMPVWQD